MRYFVYIIYSKRIDKYYIGFSKNPRKRLKYHNLGKGGGKKAYTRRTRDWILVYSKKFKTKKNALDYEKKLKRMKSRRYLESIMGERNNKGI